MNCFTKLSAVLTERRTLKWAWKILWQGDCFPLVLVNIESLSFYLLKGRAQNLCLLNFIAMMKQETQLIYQMEHALQLALVVQVAL